MMNVKARGTDNTGIALHRWALPQDGEWLGHRCPGDGCRTPQSEGHVLGTLAGRCLLQT